MSKFQSFASQGSFRDYQLQAPDESAKILEQTERNIRGKERAQRFLEGNNALYLQAQKLAQQQEELSRETNYKLETESRRLYKESLDRDYRTQTENDLRRADQQQNTFKELSNLSQTAGKLFVDFNTEITKKQTDANTVNTLLAGTTFEDNLAIQSMVNNLTEAEFAQQNFIQSKVKEGKDVKALWTLYNNRNTRGFIENAGVIENTSNAAVPFLQEVQKNLDPTLTPEQKRLEVETAWREWLANSFKDANGKQLNPKLVATIGAPIFSRAYTQVMGEFDREEKKANEEKLKQDRNASYDLEFSTGGALAVLAKSKGTEALGYLTDWALARLKAGTMSWMDAQGLITTPIIDENGKQTTWGEKHPSDANIGRLMEGVREIRRGMLSDSKLKEEEQKAELDTKSRELYNELAADGSISKGDRERLEEFNRSYGIPGYEPPALLLAREQEDSVRYDAAAKELIEKEAREGTLTSARVMAMKGIGPELRANALRLAAAIQEQQETPAYKTDVAAIKAALSQDPRVKSAPVTGKENYSVLLMQDQYVQMYKKILARTGDHAGARAQTLQAIKTLLSSPNAINKEGKYTSIVAQENRLASQSKQTLQAWQDFTKAVRDPNIRKNPQRLASVLGAGIVYSAYDDMKANKPAPQIIKNAAALMGMTPFQLINYFASGARLPALTLDSQIEEIQSKMKPITKKLYVAPYSTNDMRSRGNAINNGLVGDSPTRFGNNTLKPLSSYAAQVSSIVMESASGQPGMDIFFEDKKFPAVLPGVVKEISWQGDSSAGYGNYVVIESVDPETNEKVDVLYAHLAMPTHLKEGSSVTPGTVIGIQGGTGSVRSADGTIASIDFLAPAPKGSKSMVPYRNYERLRRQIAQLLRR